MPGTLTIGGMSYGLPGGGIVLGPQTIIGNTTIGELAPLNLAMGDNTIAVPTGATAVVFFWGTGSAITVKYRTNLNSGDAGLPAPAAGFTAWQLATGTTSVIVHASGALTGVAQFAFI